MEVEEENVPSVGHTEEVPHDASQDIAEPLGSEPLPDSNGTDVSAITPHSTNVKYLFCKYCPYKTRFVGNLTKHVRTHTGEKPFSCRHCGKRFASRSNLNYHEATHTGNKRFQCFISGCQFKTQLRESLNSHMRKIHGVLMQQNAAGGSTPTFVTSPDPMHSPPGPAPPGFPVLQPMTSIANLPPIQDILTSSAGIPTSLHSSFPPNLGSPVDVKPSVAELAQYMIALHEGTTPNLNPKSEAGPRGPRPNGPYSTALPLAATSAEYSTPKPMSSEGLNTSPVTVETDTESNQDSPRVAPITPQELGSKSWGESPVGPPPPGIQCSIPSIMPRLSASHNTLPSTGGPPPPLKGSARPNLGDLANAAAVGAAASIEAPKSSTLSTELLKIFQNLGLDTMAILELLASQGRLHICHSCNIVFPEYSTFVLHRGCHGNEGPFQCHFCQHRFPEKFGFLTHFMQCPNK